VTIHRCIDAIIAGRVTAERLLFLQGVAEVAMTGALHDDRRAGESYAVAESLGHGKVGTAYQEKAEFGVADLVEELGIAASRTFTSNVFVVCFTTL
jgi:hypothetical protein